jgi:glutathione synthase/RimK-type ligase-like ATP-grasp enzyme
MLLSANRKSLIWRSHEREAAEKNFGVIYERSLGTGMQNVDPNISVIRWWPNSEGTTISDHKKMINAQLTWNSNNPEVEHINKPTSFKYVSDKISCFEQWQENKIRIPKFFPFEKKEEFFGRLEGVGMKVPLLVRINNGVAGQHSFLVRQDTDLEKSVDQVLQWAKAGHLIYGTRALATEFIDTTHPNYPNFNVSYRIIVAGDNIVTGYARCSYKEDWVAVTNKFTPEIMEAWFFHNEILQEILETRETEIVKAVKVLDLNHQGIDIIPKFTEKGVELFFLEVQTTYDAGFIGAGPYKPPYYNPYNPALVSFIQENEKEFKEKLPYYYYNWLDKKTHFEVAYENLTKSFL